MPYDTGKITIDGVEYTYSPVISADDGNVIYSSQYDTANFSAATAFDGIAFTQSLGWWTDLPRPQYVGYDYKTDVLKCGVVICSYGTAAYNYLQDFAIEAWEDGSWKTLKSIENETSWDFKTGNIYMFDHPIKASKFRLNVTKTRDNGASALSELRFLDANVTQYALYHNADAIFGMQDGLFTKLSENWTGLTSTEQKEMFLSTNYQTADKQDLVAIGKFKVLVYSDQENKVGVAVKGAPKDQIVVPKGLISLDSFEGVDKVVPASTINGNGICKIIVTTDSISYQTYNFVAKEWREIDYADLAVVKADGIDASQLQTIDRAAWDTLTTDKSGIGFAYLLSIEDITDTCSIDKLDLQVDMRGSWDKAIHGTDYKYGYPANTALRVSLLSNGDYKINYQKE